MGFCGFGAEEHGGCLPPPCFQVHLLRVRESEVFSGTAGEDLEFAIGPELVEHTRSTGEHLQDLPVVDEFAFCRAGGEVFPVAPGAVKPLIDIGGEEGDEFILPVAGDLHAVVPESGDQTGLPDLVGLGFEDPEPGDLLLGTGEPDDPVLSRPGCEAVPEGEFVLVGVGPEFKAFGAGSLLQQVKPLPPGVAPEDPAVLLLEGGADPGGEPGVET